MDVQMRTKNNHSYPFVKDALVSPAYDYDHYVTVSLFNNQERAVYVLPKTLTALNVGYYDYATGASLSQEIVLDPSVTLQIGDAISFSIDADELMKGSGSGVFEWGDINWNDLEEISLP